MMWTVSTTLAKPLSVRLGKYLLALIGIGVGIIPMSIMYFFFQHSAVPIVYVFYGLIGGLVLTFGALLVFTTLETQQVSNTAALQEIQPPLLVIFGLFVLNEHISTLGIISILVIFAGAFLVLSTEGLKINRKFFPAVFANVLWVVYWIIMIYAVNGSQNFIFSILVSRIVGFLLVGGYMLYLASKGSKIFAIESKPDKRFTFGVIVLAAILFGFLDGGADGAFGFVVKQGLVAYGGAVSALPPMFVTMIAYLFYKERLTLTQFIGLLIMCVGAFALTLG